MKKKNAIIIADTRDYLIGQILVQLNKTNKELFDEVLIYYDKEIKENDKKIMQKLMPCRFIKFVPKIGKEFFEKTRFKKFSKLAFARYEMFNLLDKYENVLWIDTDIIIKGSLEEIIDKAKKTGIAMLCEDEKNKSSKKTDIVKTNFNKPVFGYNMNEPLHCSGVICVNEKLENSTLLTDWCYRKTEEYSDYLDLPDQGILNLMIEEFDLNVTPIGDYGKYGALPYYGRDCSKSILIHSWGRNKFWNSWYLLKKYPEWYECYQEWIKLGGTKSNLSFNPDVSVIIPIYKPNFEYFKILLNSLCNQKSSLREEYLNFEIIIVAEPQDDNKLKEFIASYKDPRINLIINKNRLGIAASLNIGMKLAKGKYIARVDDDDICDESRLFKQVEYLDNHPYISLCTSDYTYFGDMNEYRITFEAEMSKAWSLFTCPFDHPTIMFRKDFFIKNNLFYDEKRSHVEDWELWLRAFDKGMVVGCIHEFLYHHRWYNGQAGQNTKTVDMMRELVKKNFKKLGINLTEGDLKIVSPWQGKVTEEELKHIEKIFQTALMNNKELKLYDEKSLAKVFEYRLFEAKNGYMVDIAGHIKKVNRSVKRTLRQKILSPIYRPFKRIFYNIMAEAVNDNVQYLNNQNKFIIKNNLESNEKLEKSLIDFNQKIDNQLYTFDKLEKEFDELKTQITYLHDQLYDLEKKYEFIKDYDEVNLYSEKKLLLIGTSEHSNIGDAAITFGEYEFIRKYFSDYKLIEVSTYEFNDYFPYLENIVNANDLIFLHDGGSVGNKYLKEETVRRKIIESFPNNKIVILPQTIYFDDDLELSISKEIYNNHNNLIIFTRGATSLKFAKDNFSKAKSYKTVDMALNIKVNYSYERNGILCCIRDLNDESGLSKKLYNQVLDIVKSNDKNYTFSNNLYTGDIKKEMRNHVIYEQLKLFAHHKLIITDRLLGLIFSLITNTPCIVISSYNYKLNEFVELIKDNKNVVFIDKDIDKLDAEIKKMLKNNFNIHNDFSEWFDKISNIIKKG